jgi:hypothetical protein
VVLAVIYCLGGAQARFSDPLYADVSRLSQLLLEVCTYLIDTSLQDPKIHQRAVGKLASVYTAVIVVFICVCAIAYYPRITKRLNESVKGNRALLLLLPEDVVQGVKV